MVISGWCKFCLGIFRWICRSCRISWIHCISIWKSMEYRNIQKAQKFPSTKVQSSRISGKNIQLICKSFNYEKIRNSEFPWDILIRYISYGSCFLFILCCLCALNLHTFFKCFAMFLLFFFLNVVLKTFFTFRFFVKVCSLRIEFLIELLMEVNICLENNF